MLSDEQIAELRRLLDAATPGEWRACPVNREDMGVCPCVSVFCEGGAIVLSASLDGMGDPRMTFNETTMEYRREMAANLDLTAALRNAAPALLSAHADAMRLRDLLKRLLARLPDQRTDYSGVGWCAGCGVVLWVSGDTSGKGRDPCKPDCVLQEARAALRPAGQGGGE